jgi:signal transduction histidine kinase
MVLRRARLSPRDDVLLDVVAAVLLGLLGFSSLYGVGPGSRPADALGVILVLAGALCLVVARRYPLPVLVGTLATTLAVAELDYPQNGLGLTVMWALYVVAERLPRAVSLVATLVTVALANISLTMALDGATTADRVSATVVLGAGWAVGRASRARRSGREAENRAALAEERALVAREMQDLVAHELAEMTVQVTAARRLVARDPAATEELLAGAETTARTVVTEARRILALLAPDDEVAARRPLPGLDNLEELALAYGERGLPVELHLCVPGGVAPGPGLLTYRTVEDALAEARNAGAMRARVSVVAHSGDLRVRVGHDGAAVGESTAAGTPGLQRRVQLYGGSLQRAAGTRDDQATVVLEIPAAGTRRTTA